MLGALYSVGSWLPNGALSIPEAEAAKLHGLRGISVSWLLPGLRLGIAFPAGFFVETLEDVSWFWLG